MNHSTSIISLFLCVFDYRFFYLAAFCMMLEECIYYYSYFFLQNNSVKNFKNKIRSFKEKLTPVDSELIREYCKKSIEVDASPFHKDFPPEIFVYRQPQFHLNYYTFPIYPRTIYIFVKKTFDENEAIDRAVFAHELGHAFHAKFRDHKYSITTSVILLQIVITVFSLMQNYWIFCFITLITNSILFFISYIDYESNLETEADFAALKIIEKIEGNDAMKAAAVNLIKMRLEEYRTQNYEFQKKKRRVFKASIKCICPFIDEKDRLDLISQIIKKKKCQIPNSKKKDYLVMFEDFVIDMLQRMPYYPSALKNIFIPSFLYVLCATISLFATGAVVVNYFLKSDNRNAFFDRIFPPSFFIWMIMTLLLLVYMVLISKLWKRTDLFLRQNGL